MGGGGTKFFSGASHFQFASDATEHASFMGYPIRSPTSRKFVRFRMLYLEETLVHGYYVKLRRFAVVISHSIGWKIITKPIRSYMDLIGLHIPHKTTLKALNHAK
jgi:hypothetical protein